MATILTMLIMALESATQGSSVAVWQNGKVLACCCQDLTRSQAEMLIPIAKEALEKVQLLFTDIDLFAVTVGPGSFTGVRVGLATAKGLGLAAEKPVAGITTMEALVWAAHTQQGRDENYCDRYILAVLETYPAAFYVQPFQLTTILPVPLCPVQTLVPAEISDFLADLPKQLTIVGNNILQLKKYFPINTHMISGIQPQAWAVAAIAAAREGKGWRAPEPFYAPIRAPSLPWPRVKSW